LLNPAAKEILNEWFLNNLQHPYPTEDAKIFLTIKTKLSVHQIDNWLKKERLKYKFK